MILWAGMMHGRFQQATRAKHAGLGHGTEFAGGTMQTGSHWAYRQGARGAHVNHFENMSGLAGDGKKRNIYIYIYMMLARI